MSKNFENERTKKAQNHVLRAVIKEFFCQFLLKSLKSSINSSISHPKNIS